MRFSVLQFFSWPGRRIELPQVYARALERIEIMDRGGYEAVWLAEHHFNTFSVCPSVHVMGTYVAARTSRLRIGTAVTLAALYHPLRVAEEVALLDVLSGGRVNWGAGRGFDRTEFDAFGVPLEESREVFHEHFQAVLAAWREPRATYHGKHVSFEDVEVLPKPLQSPHPPVWLAATSPESVGWAAGEGHSILMDPHSTHAQIGEKRAYYTETLEKNGHESKGRDIPVARLIAIADTEAEAAEIARSGASWTVASYAAPLNPSEDPVERYMGGVVIHGTPSSVIDRLEQLREEIGLEHLMAAPLSHGSFLSLTDKVLPHFV